MHNVLIISAYICMCTFVILLCSPGARSRAIASMRTTPSPVKEIILLVYAMGVFIAFYALIYRGLDSLLTMDTGLKYVSKSALEMEAEQEDIILALFAGLSLTTIIISYLIINYGKRDSIRCPHCGEEVAQEDVICPNCSKEIEERD